MISRFLTADIGGSKTLVRYYTERGESLCEYSCRGFGKSEDSHEACKELVRFLNELPEKDAITCIAVNLGGKNTEEISASFRAVFGDIPLAVFRESQGTAALALAEKYHAGIVLSAGTGSIAVGKALSGGYVITDGWGALVGDVGSGYAIGTAAIRKALFELDGTAPLSMLAGRITGCKEPLAVTATTEEFMKKRDNIRTTIAATDRKSIASYARVAAECAKMGDRTAKALFTDAGKALAQTVIRTAEKLGGEFEKNVVITGGLANVSALWKDVFEQDVRKAFSVGKFFYLPDGLAEGTFMIATKLHEKKEY